MLADRCEEQSKELEVLKEQNRRLVEEKFPDFVGCVGMELADLKFNAKLLPS